MIKVIHTTPNLLPLRYAEFSNFHASWKQLGGLEAVIRQTFKALCLEWDEYGPGGQKLMGHANAIYFTPEHVVLPCRYSCTILHS